MPFSALSPDGPVSLLGADPTTVERLRERNRREACFTAKCCGAALTVRTAAGRAPHFVHKSVPRGCDGDRRETPEHVRLKAAIATSIERTYEWDVETEAVHRDPQTGQVLWRADVLASKRKAHVAFEVQLSGADYKQMQIRQDRYRASRVRGLWFVRTKKGFPASEELPIFVVECDDTGDRVNLLTAWDYPFICAPTAEAESMDLPEFVQAALGGNLKWAPFESAPDTWLHGYVDYSPAGACPGCGRTVARPFAVRARVPGVDTYPEFQFAKVGVFRRTSDWYQPVINLVWSRVKDEATVTFRSAKDTCCWCSTALPTTYAQYDGKSRWVAASIQLKELPKPRYTSVERSWLRRWTVLP